MIRGWEGRTIRSKYLMASDNSDPPNPRLIVKWSGKELERSHFRILELPRKRIGFSGGGASLSASSKALIEGSQSLGVARSRAIVSRSCSCGPWWPSAAMRLHRSLALGLETFGVTGPETSVPAERLARGGSQGWPPACSLRRIRGRDRRNTCSGIPERSWLIVMRLMRF